MGDVGQFASFDLGVAGSDPAFKSFPCNSRIVAQCTMHRMDDKVQKVSLVGGVVSLDGEHHPVGAAGCQDLKPGLFQVAKQVAAGSAVAGRVTVGDPFVHCAVIGCLDSGVQRSIDGRFEDRRAVKVDRKVEEAAGPEQPAQLLQRAGDVEQVQKRMGDKQVVAPLFGRAAAEFEYIGRFAEERVRKIARQLKADLQRAA